MASTRSTDQRSNISLQSTSNDFVRAPDAAKMAQLMQTNSANAESTYGDNVFLINWSRNQEFFKLCLEIMKEAKTYLHDSIEL